MESPGKTGRFSLSVVSGVEREVGYYALPCQSLVSTNLAFLSNRQARKGRELHQLLV